APDWRPDPFMVLSPSFRVRSPSRPFWHGVPHGPATRCPQTPKDQAVSGCRCNRPEPTSVTWAFGVEQLTIIELALSAWEAAWSGLLCRLTCDVGYR